AGRAWFVPSGDDRLETVIYRRRRADRGAALAAALPAGGAALPGQATALTGGRAAEAPAGPALLALLQPLADPLLDPGPRPLAAPGTVCVGCVPGGRRPAGGTPAHRRATGRRGGGAGLGHGRAPGAPGDDVGGGGPLGHHDHRDAGLDLVLRGAVEHRLVGEAVGDRHAVGPLDRDRRGGDRPDLAPIERHGLRRPVGI